LSAAVSGFFAAGNDTFFGIGAEVDELHHLFGGGSSALILAMALVALKPLRK
jgi:hypothetical protein